MSLAVALGGFGGFNLHGVGVLEALRRLDLRPDLFTATSGQIVVLAEWLRGGDPREMLLAHGGRPGAARTLATAFTGHTGVFRPATPENIARWMDVPLSAEGVLERLLPARQYLPTRPRAAWQEISDTLNNAPVGVVFNTYDYRAGDGRLHGNARATALMPADCALQPITAEAVEAALWLYLYGFKNAPAGLIDGAYHRSLILGELHGFETVIAAPPFPTSWNGPEPSNHFQVEDWKIKQWFSNSYRAEAARLRKVAALVAKGTLCDEDYRISTFTEVPIRSAWGYFDYFAEKDEVFQETLLDALDALAPYCCQGRTSA